MVAFERFEAIKNLKSIQDKHREWLKDYQGIPYSIAQEEIHLMKWKSHQKLYDDTLWDMKINCIGRHPKRAVIEFDDKDENGNKNKEKIMLHLEYVKSKLKENNWGYIESSHNGNSNYLWIEFLRDMKDKEIEQFLMWIAPEGSEIDLNFASSQKVFPILFAIHWKYSSSRELPIDYYVGNPIDYDSLDINLSKKTSKIVIKDDGYVYKTYQKDAARVFERLGQATSFCENQPLFYDTSGLFWIWDFNDRCWKVKDEVDILNMIEEQTHMDIINSKSRSEIINSLKQIGRKNNPIMAKSTWIQFRNGIVDINDPEKKIKPSSEYFITNPIPWAIGESEDTPTIDRIFGEWVGEDNKLMLYQIAAYCLLADYPIHRIFCFIGGGLNGKSKYLDLIRRFVGDNNCCATELDTLISSRFEVTRLHKKLICQMGETNFNEISKTSLLKKLSGGDLIGFEYKNKTPFEDKNYAKIIISTNNLPATSDKTIGFYRRWMIIDFPNQFSEKKDILSEIPEEEYQNLALKSCRILKDLLSNREFHNEGTIEQRMAKYESKSNFLEQFIKQFIVENSNGHITKSDFYKRFIAWCRENRHRELSETSVGLAMRKLGYGDGHKYFDWLYDGRGGNARVWLGISWN